MICVICVICVRVRHHIALISIHPSLIATHSPKFSAWFLPFPFWEITSLRRTLHPLRPRRHVIVLVITQPRRALGARVAAGVNVFEVEVVVHAVGWGRDLATAGWEDLLEELKVAHVGLVGELDVEVDVQVAKVVVAVGGHALAFDLFEVAWGV